MLLAYSIDTDLTGIKKYYPINSVIRDFGVGIKTTILLEPNYQLPPTPNLSASSRITV